MSEEARDENDRPEEARLQASQVSFGSETATAHSETGEATKTVTSATGTWGETDSEEDALDLALMDAAVKDFDAGFGAPAVTVLQRIRAERLQSPGAIEEKKR